MDRPVTREGEIMKRLIVGLAGGLVVLGGLGRTTASPVVWPQNGHKYEAVLAPGGITWDAANSAAIAAGGHLVTITSAAENNFVYSLLSTPDLWVENPVYHGPWLGGFQPPGSPEPGGNWQWVTGEPFNFTAWNPVSGEPNNAGNEDKLHFHSHYYAGPTWNDIGGGRTDLVHSYVVEIPEPSTLALLAMGAIGLLAYAWRRRRRA